jgi:hypothetical protein
MECFIKKIWQGKGEEAHNYFVRFSKGKFENRAVLNLQKSEKIKLRGSYEWANDFVKIISELADVKFSGIILSKENLELENKKKKSGINEYGVSDISSEKIKELKDKAYAMLLDAESSDLSLKMKKKLPKPGKSGGGKVDDKFCQLEADLKFWPQIKEAFMLPECKKAKISHTFLIEEIILPQGEKDFAKIRELARRKGKIIRKMEIDGKESQEEKSFEA